MQWARQQFELGVAYYQKYTEDEQEEYLEFAIACFENSLQMYTRKFTPLEWAKVQAERGRAYRERVQGNREENLNQSLFALEQALTVYTFTTAPFEWAALHLQLGLTYRDQIQHKGEKDQEQAIACFVDALQVYTQERFPREWAQTQTLLGLIYLLPHEKGEKEENIRQAIAYFEASLQVYISEAFPIEHYQNQTLLRNAFQDLERIQDRKALEQFTLTTPNISTLFLDDLGLGSQTASSISPFMQEFLRDNDLQMLYGPNDELTLEQLQQKILLLQTAIQQSEIQMGHSIEWAELQIPLGRTLYRSGREGNTNDLQRALLAYEEALLVYTRHTFPEDWAMVQCELGDVYAFGIGGNRRESLKRAISHYEAALQVHTREALPSDHCNTQLRIAAVHEEMENWSSAHNAYIQARKAQGDLMMAAATEAERAERIAEQDMQFVYVKDANCLLHLDPPRLEEVAIALEEGRARSLRTFLDLDAVNLHDIKKPASRSRVVKFMLARDAWRDAQRAFVEALSQDTNKDDLAIEKLRTAVKDTYHAVEEARDQIRWHDDPEFLSPQPTMSSFAQTITSPEEALIYLVDGELRGFALVITKRENRLPSVEHISLPLLSTEAIFDLFYTQSDSPPEDLKHLGHELFIGGYRVAQTMSGLPFLEDWGTNARVALTNLPSESSFAKALLQLFTQWPNHRKYAPLVPLLEIPFSQMSESEHNLVLGELGINALAQSLSDQGIRKITVIPYGFLALLPLPAVSVHIDHRQGPLSEIFETAIAPSAHTLSIAKERSSPLEYAKQRPYIVAVGNPLPLSPGIPALPFAQAEAETSCRLANTFGYPKVDVHCVIGEQATRTRVMELLRQSWFALLAMHAQFRPDDPRQSHLLLPYNENITLEECLNGQLDLKGLRLMILSACETLTIDVIQALNEMNGIASGFLYAGVVGIVASLWPVDDRATYLLMTRFANFKGRSQQGEHAAAGGELDERLTALRASLVIASQPTPSGDPGKAAFHHHLLGSGRKPEGKSFSQSTSVPSGTSRPRSGAFRRRTMAMVQPRCSLSHPINVPQ